MPPECQKSYMMKFSEKGLLSVYPVGNDFGPKKNIFENLTFLLEGEIWRQYRKTKSASI